MLRRDANGDMHAVNPSPLYGNSGYVAHPLQRIGVSPQMPWYARATIIPANVLSWLPNMLANLPPAITIKH